MIGLAFQQGKYVWFLDRRSSPNKLIRLHDDHDVAKYKADLWGKTQAHKRTFVVISENELVLREKK